MTTYSLNDLCELINEQSFQREELAASLAQSIALLKMAMSKCFQEQEDEDQHDYLWAITTLLDSAKMQNEQQIEELMTKTALLEKQLKK